MESPDYPERIEVGRECAELLRHEDGLDLVCEMIAEALSQPLRETAYALACDVAAADGVDRQPPDVGDGHRVVALVDAEERTAAIDAVAREIEAGYVFADVGRSMAEEIRGRAARGEYDSVSEGEALARLLTDHLRSISNDLHVVVRFFPDPPPVPAPGVEGSEAEMRERFHADLARDNYGFRRVEILPGNIGYVRFDLFAPPELAAGTYSATMAFVAGTDALIIDLRENGGSISPDAIRGNEDLREVRAGFDIGRTRWLRVRYIRGLESRASPAHGLRVSAGMLLERGS